MPFSSRAYIKKYLPIQEYQIKNIQSDKYLSAVDKKNKLIYNVNYYNCGYVYVFDLNTGEKIDEIKDDGSYMCNVTCVVLDEESQLLYVGTRYNTIVIFDVKNKRFLCNSNIDIGWDVFTGIKNICLINNDKNVSDRKNIICFCDDYILHKFEWKLNENDNLKLELVNGFYIQDYLTENNENNEFVELHDVDSMLYDSHNNNCYIIGNNKILIIDVNECKLKKIIDLKNYLEYVSKFYNVLIKFEYNSLIYKDLLILSSNTMHQDNSVIIIINLQTQQKSYFNKVKNINEICLGNNETEGILFILGDNNVSIIDLLNINTVLNKKSLLQINYTEEGLIYELSAKSYVLNILQQPIHLNLTIRSDQLDILFINNNELTIVLNDNIIRQYNLDNLYTSNIIYKWCNIFKSHIENNNLESLNKSKLNALNKDILLEVFESI